MAIVVELLLTRLLPLIAALGYLILHRVGEGFVKSQWNAVTSSHNIIVRSALAPAVTVGHGIRWLWNHVDSGLSHSAGASLGLLAFFFAGLTHVVEQIGTTIEEGQRATTHAIAHVVNVKTPAQIHHRVAPVKATAGHALDLGRRSISLNHREASDRRRAIDRIHWKWLAPLALAFGGIDAMLHRDLLHRTRTDHRTLERTVTRQRVLQRTTRAHARRLSRLEKLIGLGVITALLVKVLARVAPWLFCRNVNRLARTVCGMNSSLLSDLLQAVALIGGTLSLVEFAREVQGETRIAVDGIRAFIDETRNIG